MNLLTELKHLLKDSTIELTEQVQSLWSGYGRIVRCKSDLTDTCYIVKEIQPTEASDHPRGWNTSVSHQRKLTSYQVEANFYQYYAQLTDEHSRVPTLIASRITDTYTLLVMEDLDYSGYNERKEIAQWNDLAVAIKWLAYFHARFMHSSADNLWSTGTYWHLSTRQDEFSAMAASELKQAASDIDKVLNNAQFQTLVHGDAKFENLCFYPDGKKVAAVDFQYIGKGSGVKDLAYLVGSCLSEDKLIEFDHRILDEYLTQLKKALVHYEVALDFEALSKETHALYPVAWADFYRFLLGWNPNSWKVCNFMKQKSKQGLLLI